MASAGVTGPSKKQEEEWQAEDDARTMQRMGEIMADPKRYERAKKKSDEIIANMEKSRQAMERINKAGMVYDKAKMKGEKEG